MLNKKYLPTFGFVILSITIACSILFLKWAAGPLSFEKAACEEQQGHQLAKQKKAKEASIHFLKAAMIKDDNISTSRRYRCAGSTSSNEDDRIKYYKLALKYNPNNTIAERELKPLLADIIYKHRYADGWSIGKYGSAILRVKEKAQSYNIVYYTSGPPKTRYKVKIFVDGNLYSDQVIISRKSYSAELKLIQGRHNVKFTISDTFNPKKIGINQDTRDLGVHFKIIKKVNKK